jgi:hypothetical protein
MDDDELDSALLGFYVNEDSLLFAIVSQLDNEGYMVLHFRGDIPQSVRITPAGERICRLLEE